MSVPGNGIGASSATPQRLEAEQIRLLYANLPLGVIAGLLNAGLLVYIQRDVIASAAMAAEDRVIDGALRQAGIVRLYQYSHLFLAAKALASMPLPRGNRVSFLAPSGAMLVVLTDLCLSLGLKVPAFGEPTRQFLQSISPPIVRMRNPVDIWFFAGIHRVEFAYREGTEVALKDPNIDAVVPILLLTDETGVPALDFLVDLAKKYPEKPIYVTFTGEKKHKLFFFVRNVTEI